jgi:copper chaperone
MEFLTNLKCSGCIAEVSTKLNELAGVAGWEVDLTDPDRKLTIHNKQVSDLEVISILNRAGFKANPI